MLEHLALGRDAIPVANRDLCRAFALLAELEIRSRTVTRIAFMPHHLLRPPIYAAAIMETL